MPPRVLVLTPDSRLGETVRRALLDAGGCQAVLAYNSRQANRFARQVVFDLAILDEDTPEEGLPELVRCLQEVQPRLSILTIQAHGVLKPANGMPPEPAADPNVLRAVEAVLRSYISERSLPQPEPAALPSASVSPAVETAGWLSTPGQAAEWLDRALLRCQPQPPAVEAVLLIRRASLWASAGTLPAQQSSEAMQLLVQAWTREMDPRSGTAAQAGGDMARYIRLKSGPEFLLYARPLGYGMILGLVLNADFSVSAARRLIGQIGQWLQVSSVYDQVQRGLPVVQVPAESSPLDHAVEPKFELEDVPPPTPEQLNGKLPQVGQMVWPWELDEGDPGPEAGG